MPIAPSVPQVATVSPAVARDPGVRASPAAFGAGTSQALAQASAALTTTTLQVREADRDRRLAGAQANASIALNQFTASFNKRSDYENFGTEYQAGAQAIFEQFGSGLDEQTQARFAASFVPTASKRGLDVEGAANKGMIDRQRADYAVNMDKFKDIAAAGDEQSRVDATNNAAGLIDAMVTQRVISAEKGASDGLSFESDVAETLARGMILAAPVEAEEALLGDDPRLAALSSDKRNTLLARAQAAVDREERRFIRTEDRAERKAREAVEREQEDNELSMMIQLREGTLTEDQILIEGQQRGLDVGGFRALTKALDDDADQDNPDTLVTLTDAMTQGADMRGAINRAIERGDFTGDTGATMLEKNRAIQRQEGVFASQDYRTSINLIEASIITTGPASQFVKGDEQIRLARAQKELDRRVFAGENVDAVTVDIINRYRSAPPNMLEFPRPRYLQGGQMNDINALSAAKTATVRALDAGNINEQTAADEIRLIDQIMDANRIINTGNTTTDAAKNRLKQK